MKKRLTKTEKAAFWALWGFSENANSGKLVLFARPALGLTPQLVIRAKRG